MSGQGKYTVYAPPANDKNTLMAKLYPAAPTAELVGKETEARVATVDLARTHLTPAVQQGDMGYFPQGVQMDYQGAPDLTTVEWTNAGDPSNGFFPDISSPGPGKTDGTDKDSDPELRTIDVKPNYVVGSPNGGTTSPATTNAKLVAASLLGVPGAMGDSGANT